jgi:hypothetical protein
LAQKGFGRGEGGRCPLCRKVENAIQILLKCPEAKKIEVSIPEH